MPKQIARVYVEYGSGLRAVTLGHAFPRVTEAAAAALREGTNFLRPSRDCNLVFGTKDPTGLSSQAYRTLFMQELIRRGVLAPSFVVNYSHDEVTIQSTVDIVSEALDVYRSTLEDGVERYLNGLSVEPPYRRYN